jgi:polyisoprenoid-binding protein YceI
LLAGCTVAALAIGALSAAVVAQTAAPLALTTGRITLDGSSNLHEWTASSTSVRLTHVQVSNPAAGAALLDHVLTPGALQAFDIAVPVTTLKSPKDGLDKNMYKALKSEQFPEIVFRMRRLESRGAAGALRAVGVLTIAGVDREVTFDVNTERVAQGLRVQGQVALLMTDFGIAPPKAMLGMLKTDPKVTVRFDTVLANPAS